MRPRTLGRILLGYLAFLVVVCAGVHRAAALRDVEGGDTILTAWRRGESVARAINGKIKPLPDMQIANEQIVAEGAILTSLEPAFALSLVPGRDGVEAKLNGLTAYVTPDDLLSHQAYDHGVTIPSLTLSFGVDVQLVLALLAQRLDTTVPEVRARAQIRRIRTKHLGLAPGPFAATKPEDITPELLRGAALDAARFLARGVGADGRFRYIIDAPSGRTLAGYDWPRHAGATYFLAQAAQLSSEPSIRDAALRSGTYLRDRATLPCGALRCVGSDAIVDVGSSALALIAMSEIARSGIGADGFRPAVEDLAKFLRAQQRPDGEFMHEYDRRASKPIDIQFMYYSGEATLALARAYQLTGDPADLDAAKRGLAHLVGPAWSFFGDRYYFGEEHWTCQAMADLWDAAPNPAALDFCARWREYDAHMMYAPGESPYDADGAFGVGPVITPRLTPVASRTEAGVSTLDAMIKSGADPARERALGSQLRRSFALLLRQQLRPGLAHLFADPAAVYGAIPGSPVDWQLRIDFAQHAGSAMIRAASLWSAAPPQPPKQP